MAELAAGAVAVEQVVETGVQTGVAAYLVAKPTMPLKATFTRIATSSDDATRLSLSRSGHSLSVVKKKAYIFGGETAAGKLAGNEIHMISLESSEKPAPGYAVIPAVPDREGGKVPIARTKHAACAFNVCVAIFGGVDDGGGLINEEGQVWLYNTAKSAWETLDASHSQSNPPQRSGGVLLNDNNNLVLYGGQDGSGEALKDVWYHDYAKKSWSKLADAPVSASSAAVADSVLYVVAGGDSMTSDLHALKMVPEHDEHQTWTSIAFPTNPLTPGPLPRTDAGLLHVSTGYGRNYLLYMFGRQKPSEISKDEQPSEYWSDMWTWQLASGPAEAKLTTSIADSIKPARIKDSIRSALGYDSGKHSWGEVEILPPTELESSEGKIHPGPRAHFAADVMSDGQTAVLWGGINAKGDVEGDGWTIKLK